MKIKMALRKCGFKAKWTDNEIKTLLRRSLAKQQRERKGTVTNGENGTRFALIDDKTKFISALNDFEKGILDKTKPIEVTSETPSILLKLDLSDKGFKIYNRKITIPYSVIEKAIGLKDSTTTKEGHDLDIETLKELPDSLYNPVMVLDSDTENSIEIYTLLADKKNHPVMIALRIDQKEQRPGRRNSEYVVNSIRSIYGKENHNTAINKLKNGYGRYVNMKLAALYETAFGVQFPGASSIKNSSKYTIIDNPAKSSKNQKNIRFSLNEGENNTDKYGYVRISTEINRK